MFDRNLPQERNSYRRRFGNHLIQTSIRSIDSSNQYLTITKEKKQEIESDKDNLLFLPFVDNEREMVKILKSKISKVKILTEKPTNSTLIDQNLIILRDITNFDSIENTIKYPFSFNYYEFQNRSGKIDVYSNVSKIQRTNTFIDDMKGINGFTLGTSKNAYGETNTVTQKFIKKEINTFAYEDNVIETFIVNNQINYVIEKLIFELNNVTNVRNFTVVKKAVNKHSDEQRYFAYQDVLISPYKDISFYQNNTSILQNRFILTNSDHNDIMLENRNKLSSIKEDDLFYNSGYDCDFSLSNGKDSISFISRID